MTHPAISPGRVAVITGAASGIGLATARALAGQGMRLVLADLDGPALTAAQDSVAAITGAAGVMAMATNVANPGDLAALRDATVARFGDVALLMNNAGIGGGGQLSGDPARWRQILDVNLWGAINGIQAFVPVMQAQGGPAAIICTGSKQGITCPPGDTAYNISKAGIKVVTEALAHDLRQSPGNQISAHLLIPGFTHTGMTGSGAKPDAAWSADQVTAFLLQGMAAGDFYILCPDNAVSRRVDEIRIAWAAGDIIENRPPLSRWHPDWAAAFAAALERGLKQPE